MANEKKETVSPITDEEMLEAIQIDMEFNEYYEKVKNGTLTPEEQALRKELLEFMGFKDEEN